MLRKHVHIHTYKAHKSELICKKCDISFDCFRMEFLFKLNVFYMVVLCSFALCIFSFHEVDELHFKPEGPQRHRKKQTHTHS